MRPNKALSFWRHLPPPLLLVASFALLVGVGTLGLWWLPGLQHGAPMTFVDSLFTMTSAVCVTGLAVQDTATHFTRAGQLWILVFVQLGGLGLITLTSLVIGSLGRRLSLRSQVLAAPRLGGQGPPNVVALTLAVARFTLLVEGVGALALWLLFLPRLGAAEAAWHAVFHAVSAFCNAGFSTFSTSLAGFVEAPPVLVIFSVLIILGGLGYLSLEELARWWRGRLRRHPQRLSSHTFAVLATTGALLAVGWALFAAFEWTGALGNMTAVDKAANAWFMSVTCRTAGFNSLAYGEVSNQTAALNILLMMVGGAPGSTAGGIKVTSLALLVALARARVFGRRHVELHGRSVPDGTVDRTVSLVLLSSLVIVAGVFLLSVTEAHHDLAEARRSFLPLVFEVVSAFGTVGLSMDVTPTLSPGGRLLVCGLMFVGRVGPLAFFAAVSARGRGTPAFRSAREDLIVG